MKYSRMESKVLEFKAKLDDYTRLTQAVVAFANTQGGTIVLGIRDKDRGIIGLSDTDIERYHAELPQAVADAVTEGLGGSLSGRWGVLAGEGLNWMGSLLPGTGIELSDGGSVTLVEFDETREGEDGRTGRAILVEIVKDGDTTRRWVRANVGEDGDLVRFDCPEGLDALFVVYAWRDGAATVAGYVSGEPRGVAELELDQQWRPEDCDYEIRLDGLLGAAVPVPVSAKAKEGGDE